MKLETFFEKFEMFADALNAVAKMRELVLHLAVTGKLVPQDSNDESAATLCDPDEELVAQSSFEIPHGWAWTRLNNLADINGGFAFKSNAYTEEGTRVVRISDFDEFGFKDHKVVRHPFMPDLEKFSIAQNNILMAMTGGTVGKSYLVKSLSEQMVVNQRVATIKVSEQCANPSYIDIAVRSEMTQAVIQKAKNSTNDNISMGDIKGFAIPLPPLAEQKRIVAKVDELMVLCDRLEAQQQEREEKHKALSRASLARFADAPTPANLQFIFHPSYTIAPADLRKSILTLAVQGKLVPQDPEDEQASHQFDVIQARKKELVQKELIKAFDPSRPVDPDEVDHDIPDSWVWVRLVEICELITDGTHLTPKYTESGRMFLSAQNVKPFKFMPAKHRFVSEEHYQGYVKSRKPEKGDVLLTRVGAGIGEAATIDQDLDFAIYVSLGLVRPMRGFVFSDYITLWLNSPDGTEKSSRNTYGKGVSQGNLNLSLIRNFLVPLPPLAEQRRIVAKVDELMKLVDALETQLAACRTTAANLLAALVAELTGTPNTAKASIPASTNTGTGTGRRGRPPKS